MKQVLEKLLLNNSSNTNMHIVLDWIIFLKIEKLSEEQYFIIQSLHLNKFTVIYKITPPSPSEENPRPPNKNKLSLHLLL